MRAADEFDLARFITAQDPVFEDVLNELRAGRKLSHWMWFIFPQIDGLGFSSTTRFYAIKGLDEARAYLAHPVLGPRLTQCAGILLSLEGRSAAAILGVVDALKLRSSMTLFAHVGGADATFARVLVKYFAGDPDPRTLQLLGSAGPSVR